MKQGGYLMVDHRASPGIPEDVALEVGFDPKLAGEGKLFEADTLTCAHCKTSQIKNPMRQRPRETCRYCNFHYICDICAAAMQQPDYTHAPFDKVAEQAIKRAAQTTYTPPPPTLILPPTD